MRFLSPQRNGGALLIAAIAAASACSAGETTDKPATPAVTSTRPCTTPADSVLGLATAAFTRHISPKPHRYLVPVGTDSALPASALWALQTSGATLNLFPRDTAQQRKVKAQLGANGSYTMLLVNYHGQRTLPDGRTALDFSGHYMGGDVEGKAVPRTTIVFTCHATGERFVVEGSAPAPATTP
jgi:hypothetical protein